MRSNGNPATSILRSRRKATLALDGHFPERLPINSEPTPQPPIPTRCSPLRQESNTHTRSHRASQGLESSRGHWFSTRRSVKAAFLSRTLDHLAGLWARQWQGASLAHRMRKETQDCQKGGGGGSFLTVCSILQHMTTERRITSPFDQSSRCSHPTPFLSMTTQWRESVTPPWSSQRTFFFLPKPAYDPDPTLFAPQNSLSRPMPSGQRKLPARHQIHFTFGGFFWGVSHLVPEPDLGCKKGRGGGKKKRTWFGADAFMIQFKTTTKKQNIKVFGKRKTKGTRDEMNIISRKKRKRDI